MINKFSQFLGLAKRAGKLLEGYNKSEEGIRYKKAKLLLLAEELSPKTVSKFTNLCQENNIQIISGIKKEFFYILDDKKDVKVISVTDKEMAKKLVILWNEVAPQNNSLGGEVYDEN